MKTTEKKFSSKDAQFKILVIRVRTEMVEYGPKRDEKEKVMQREIKENVQGTNSDGKETWLKSTIWTNLTTKE